MDNALIVLFDPAMKGWKVYQCVHCWLTCAARKHKPDECPRCHSPKAFIRKIGEV